MDGRYFNKVLEEYEGLIPNPLYLTITDSDVQAKMESSHLTMDVLNVMRVVITTPKMRHSTLLVIDPCEMMYWWWNPRVGDSNLRLHTQCRLLIKQYMGKFGTFAERAIEEPIAHSGYCNAYVLKYALSLALGEEYEEGSIITFAREVEANYAVTGPPELEYEFGGAAIGAIGGLILGGAIAGPLGLVVGGAAGAVAGDKLIKKHSIYDSRELLQ